MNDTKLETLELDSEYIVSRSVSVFPKCGVYFLIKDNQIVYIGKSVNIPQRLKQHKPEKDFDKVFFVECDESKLDEIEQQYIRKFAPPLNKKLYQPQPRPPKKTEAVRVLDQAPKIDYVLIKTSHVKELCYAAGLDGLQFVRLCRKYGLSRNTAKHAFRGFTDLNEKTIIAIARLFGCDKPYEQVLEVRLQ